MGRMLGMMAKECRVSLGDDDQTYSITTCGDG